MTSYSSKVDKLVRILAEWLRFQSLPRVVFPDLMKQIIGDDLDFLHQYFDEISFLLEEREEIVTILRAFIWPESEKSLVVYTFHPAKAKRAGANVQSGEAHS